MAAPYRPDAGPAPARAARPAVAALRRRITQWMAPWRSKGTSTAPRAEPGKEAAASPGGADVGSISLCATAGPGRGDVVVFSDEGEGFRVDAAGAVAARWQAHAKSISSAHSRSYATSEDDGTPYSLVTGSRDCSVKVWDAALTCKVHIPDAHELNVTAVCAHPQENGIVASGSRDTMVKVWDHLGEQIASAGAPRNLVTCMSFGHDSDVGGDLLWQGSEDLAVRAWDWRRAASAQQASLTLQGYVYFPVSMALHGHMLMTGAKGFQANEGCEVHFWDLRKTSEPLAVLAGHEQDVVACCFLQDGRRAASLSKDSTIRTWDLSQGAPRSLEKIRVDSTSQPVAMVCLDEVAGELATLEFCGQLHRHKAAIEM